MYPKTPIQTALVGILVLVALAALAGVGTRGVLDHEVSAQELLPPPPEPMLLERFDPSKTTNTRVPQTTPLLSENLKKLRFGVVLPLSGRHKRLGEVVQDALTLAKVDFDGVDLVIEDSAGTVDGARAAVERLAANPAVIAIVGPLGWKESKAAAERAQELEIPMISLSAEHALEEIGPYIFRARPSVEEQAKAIGEFALKDLQVPRYAILHPDDVLGKAAAEVFYETIRNGGGRITATATYKTDDTNLMVAVEELVGKRGPRLASRSVSKPPKSRIRPFGRDSHVNFDVLFIPDYGDTVALATKFLQFHDVSLAGIGETSSVQLLGTMHMPGPHLVDADGLASGALYPELFDRNSDHPGVPQFVRNYRDAFDRDVSDVEAQAYDMYRLLIESLVLRPDRPAPMLQPGPEARKSFIRRMQRTEPIMGLTGLRWWHPGGAPGYRFEIWVVGAGGDVSLAIP